MNNNNLLSGGRLTSIDSYGILMDFCQYKQQWKNGVVLKVNPKGTSQTSSCYDH
ncbi:zinc ribbon domain-containing protein [Vibrio sp. V15_P4S5T153]|uniref:zinc ribbon domain-containing protein n=1 Tax=Vibrio sp. V15_P4S5T153 TaxID=1938669 RepID=UPI0040401631